MKVYRKILLRSVKLYTRRLGSLGKVFLVFYNPLLIEFLSRFLLLPKVSLLWIYRCDMRLY